MNWNRILNTMIIIFVGMNLLMFAYSHFIKDDDYALSSEKKQQLNEILYSNGIIMSGEYPDFAPMESIAVSVPDFDREGILMRIFDGKTYEATQDMTEERIIYEDFKYGDEEIIFYEGNYGGLIDYYGPSTLYKPSEMTETTVLEIAQEFAEDLIGDSVVLSLSTMYYDDEENIYHLLFNEYRNEILMLCNYVELSVGEEGVLLAHASVYNKTGSLTGEKNLYPIDEALYMWMDSVDINAKILSRIESIELGYHLGLDELNKDTSIEAVPNYRIILSDGQIFEIEAYTNTIRRDTFIGVY